MKTQQHLAIIYPITLAAALLLGMPTAKAALFDLSAAPSSGIRLPDGSVFQVNDPNTSTGTGVINPFLSLQSSPNEQGYNLSSGNFDTKRNGQYTTNLQVKDLVYATNNLNFVSFLIDVNEGNSSLGAKISLDRLMIWTSPTLLNSTSVDANGNFNGSLGTLLYDMDSTANGGSTNSILYIDGLNGSGSGDIRFFVPGAAFAGLNLNNYIYMYQQWGTTSGYESDGGFEETLSSGCSLIPEVNSLGPLLLVMAAGIGMRSLRHRSTLTTE
jgi:hypothetical protein